MAGRGRPRKDDAKRNVITFRLDKNESAKLDAVCAITSRTRTDLVKEAINLFYEKHMNK